MKIGPLENKALTPLAGDRSTPARAGKTEQAAPESSTQVSLSSAATALSDTAADFDAGKVQRVSSQIGNGQYQVNAEVIADKLISNAQELLSRGAH